MSKRPNRHKNAPKSLKQMIIRLPDSVDLDNLDDYLIDGDETEATLSDGLAKGLTQFGGVVVGSEVYLAQNIVICLTYLSKGGMTSLLADHNTSWTVLATEGLPMIQTQILKFMSDVITYDENGDVVSTDPVLDVEGTFQTYAGHNWNY